MEDEHVSAVRSAHSTWGQKIAVFQISANFGAIFWVNEKYKVSAIFTLKSTDNKLHFPA